MKSGESRSRLDLDFYTCDVQKRKNFRNHPSFLHKKEGLLRIFFLDMQKHKAFSR